MWLNVQVNGAMVVKSLG
ncbi:hypothetical protein AZE42_09954 [Rhizopogon vesiculosus]|uniref:Uncharacterized protein n=1 Tax=Rhizopogon vesiculosus TaxID=180088 RepID=A0A1J8QKG7_9AGAM|nr:hypothetical protein AZE42_09954 [Rhizopogon vesiculosus]